MRKEKRDNEGKRRFEKEGMVYRHYYLADANTMQ